MMTEAEYQLFLNNHVLIVKGSRIGIIDERRIIKRSEAINTYANRFTELDGRRIKVFERWMKDTHRKSCHDTWFSPTKDVLIYAQGTDREALYWNTYIPPEERQDTCDDGKIEVFKKYLKLLDDTGWLLSLVASMVKKPMERSQEVPLLISNEVHDSLFKLISRLVNKLGTKFRSEHPSNIRAKKDRESIYSSVFHVISVSNEMTNLQIDNVKSYFYPNQKYTEIPSSDEVMVYEKKLELLIEDSDFLDQVFSYLKRQL